jgi:hypothetical protein
MVVAQGGLRTLNAFGKAFHAPLAIETVPVRRWLALEFFVPTMPDDNGFIA